MSMSILDEVVAAVAPPESEDTRLKARAKARASADPAEKAHAIKAYTEQAAASHIMSMKTKSNGFWELKTN